MSDYVFPNCQSVVAWEGQRIRLNPDQQWRADDPFVKARPEFFDVDPVRVSNTQPETMTARPGEQRSLPPRRVSSKRPTPKKGAAENGE